MRRALSVIGVCLFLVGLTCFSQAQFNSFPPGTFGGRAARDAAGGGGGRTCTDGTEAANWIARVSSPSNALADAYCEMINGLVADGTIDGNLSGATGCGSFLNGLYIFWTKDTTTANLNLCGTSFGLTQQGSVTFTANSNYQPDGSTGYFKTGFTAGTGPFQQNASSLGAYILNSRTTGASTVWLGTTNTGATAYSYLGYTTVQQSEVNGFTFSTVTSANASGINIVTRTSSTNYNAYRNGSSLGSVTSLTTGLTALEMYVAGAFNSNGTPTSFNGDQIGAIFFGGNVDSKVTSLSNRINCMAFRQGVNTYASTC